MPSGIPLTDAYNTALALSDSLAVASMGLNLTQIFGLPENYAPDLREHVKDEASELVSLIDFVESRSSRRLPAQLPVSSREYQIQFWRSSSRNPITGPVWESNPPGEMLAFADMADRLFLAPSARAGVDVAPTTLRQFNGLSRYQANVVVRTNTSLEPRWLAYLLFDDSYLELPPVTPAQRRVNEPADAFLVRRERIPYWRVLLAGPAAAPVLQGALLHFVRPQYSLLAARIGDALTTPSIDLFDIDTAAAVAVLAWRGEAVDLCSTVLDFIIESCANGTWVLCDIPDQIWPDLADVLVSSQPGFPARRRAFAEAFDKQIPSFISRRKEASSAPGFFDVELLIQGLRIGSKYAQKNSHHITERIFDHDALVDNRQRRWFLLVMRWALENRQRKLLDGLMNGRFGESRPERAGDRERGWRYFFGAPDDLDIEMFDVDALSRDLSSREANDLRWVVNAIRHEGGASRRRGVLCSLFR